VYVLLLVCGAGSGFLAGLLGIGGGFVVVPALLFVLPLLKIDPVLIPTVAVATSLAAMVPTAMSAVFAQYRRRALRIEWVRLLAPGVAFGAALGSICASAVNGAWVAVVFALYAAFFALRLLRQTTFDPSTSAPPGGAHWVKALPQWSVGTFIGGVSALAGVGGASLVVPYLLMRDAGMRQASAASSAVGLVSALVGVAGFGLFRAPAIAGAQTSLVGFIYWPAALAIGASAIFVAPLGVATAHRLPVERLKQAFAVVLMAVALAAVARVFV
jgi:uncharacterized membrane protein YfcA